MPPWPQIQYRNVTEGFRRFESEDDPRSIALLTRGLRPLNPSDRLEMS